VEHHEDRAPDRIGEGLGDSVHLLIGN
jgi:hypothetical protein